MPLEVVNSLVSSLFYMIYMKQELIQYITVLIRLCETSIPKNIFNEVSAKSIISFFKIHFDSHPTFHTFFALHQMNNVLGYNNIV